MYRMRMIGKKLSPGQDCATCSVVFRKALCANCNGQKFPRSVRPCRVWHNCSRSILAISAFLWVTFVSSARHRRWSQRWKPTRSGPRRTRLCGQGDSEVERGAGRPRATRSRRRAAQPGTATYPLRLLQQFWGQAQRPPRPTSPFLKAADCSQAHGFPLQ